MARRLLAGLLAAVAGGLALGVLARALIGLPLLVLRLVDGLTGQGRAAGLVAAPVEQPLPG